nr:hypothetical protein CFP56_67066 [Quercus suber]
MLIRCPAIADSTIRMYRLEPLVSFCGRIAIDPVVLAHSIGIRKCRLQAEKLRCARACIDGESAAATCVLPTGSGAGDLSRSLYVIGSERIRSARDGCVVRGVEPMRDRACRAAITEVAQ